MLLHVEKLNPADYVEEHPLWMNGAGVGNQQERAVGWHAGEVIKGIGIQLGEKTWAPSKALKTEDGGTEEKVVGFEWNWRHIIGLSWETFMVKRTPTIWQPGEMGLTTGIRGRSKDGRSLGMLYLNPDGYTPEDEWRGMGASRGKLLSVLEEYKYTAKSENRPPESFWNYLMQCKIYLAGLEEMLGEEHRFARLWICHARGGYKPGNDMETAYCWWIEFTRQEIDDNKYVVAQWLKEQRNK